MQLKLNCHKLKIDYYTYSMFQVSLRVNTKQKPTADTHKIEKKESKCTTTENHLEICMETQTTLNSQSSLEGKKRSWRNQTP